MSNDLQKRPPAPASLYRQDITNAANQMLVDMLGTEKGQKAAARTALAFSSAARTARDPNAYYNCDRGSVASCVAYSALTGLMPGGVNAECWLIPRGRELTWMVSHRGLMRLAREAGYTLRPVVVYPGEDIKIEMGEVVEHASNPDAWATNLKDIRGVYVAIIETATGLKVGAPWVPLAAIEEINRKAKTGPVWKEWPAAMAMKTAIKWVCARGHVPMTSEGNQAIDLENQSQAAAPSRAVADADFEEVQHAAGMLPDFGDEDEEVSAEVVTVDTNNNQT